MCMHYSYSFQKCLLLYNERSKASAIPSESVLQRSVLFKEISGNKNRQLYSDQEFLLSLSDNPNKVNMFKQFRDKYPIRRETLFLKNL